MIVTFQRLRSLLTFFIILQALGLVACSEEPPRVERNLASNAIGAKGTRGDDDASGVNTAGGIGTKSGTTTSDPKANGTASAVYSSSPDAPLVPNPQIISVKGPYPKKLIQKTETTGFPSGPSSFEYTAIKDSLKRLVKYGANNANYWTEYEYDGASKRLSKSKTTFGQRNTIIDYKYDDQRRIVEMSHSTSSSIESPWEAVKTTFGYFDPLAQVIATTFARNGSILAKVTYDLRAMTETFTSDSANYSFKHEFIGLSSSQGIPVFTLSHRNFALPITGSSFGTDKSNEKPTYSPPDAGSCTYNAITQRRKCETQSSRGKVEVEFSLVRFETPGEHPNYQIFIHRQLRNTFANGSTPELMFTHENAFNANWGTTKTSTKTKFVDRNETSSEVIYTFGPDQYNASESKATYNNSPTVTRYKYVED